MNDDTSLREIQYSRHSQRGAGLPDGIACGGYTMRVLELGHVNFWVSRLEPSARFYGEILGFPEVASGELNGHRVAFYSLGARHHDLALVEIGGDPGQGSGPRPGLNHIGLKVGDSVEELRLMCDRLATFGVTPVRMVDHRVCRCVHVHDPDGNVIELYADGDAALWRQEPGAMVHSEAFRFD
jgi:catechol 2,3-dioxygenase